VFDMTKKWTWEYVTRELPKIAKKGIQVLLVGNFRDMGESGRVVSTLTAQSFCMTAGDNVHYVEASMKNGYGVRAIASFFSLPFLDLQKKYIDEQLRRNLEETDAALTEIKALSEELTYDMYMKQLADRKAAKASTPTPTPKQPEPEPEPEQPKPKPQSSPKQEKKPAPLKTSELPTVVDSATVKRLEQEEKQRAKEEAKAAKARAEEEKRKAKEDEKRRKEEARKAEEFNKKHAKELEAKRKKQAEEDAAAAEELKRLAAGQATKKSSTQGESLASVDDFKITDNDGWLSQSMDQAGVDDDGWLVTPEGKNTGKADPFAFGADDDDDDNAAFGKFGDDDEEEEEEKPKPGKKKGKKGAHKQAFLGDSDDL